MDVLYSLLYAIPAVLFYFYITSYGKSNAQKLTSGVSNTPIEPDTRLPFAGKVCSVCFNEPGSGILLRCSVCKNQFYCSQVCQTKDWRAHKYNCSVLPPGGLLPAEIEDQVELHAEVARLTKLLIGWNNAHADDESASTDKFSSSKIPEARLIADLKIFPLFHYARLPPSHEKFPFRAPLVRICRLFWMDFIARLPANTQTSLETSLAAVQVPSNIPSIYGPKVIALPGSLSPGEYEALGYVHAVMLALDDRFGLDKDQWMSLASASRKLWNAPA